MFLAGRFAGNYKHHTGNIGVLLGVLMWNTSGGFGAVCFCCITMTHCCCAYAAVASGGCGVPDKWAFCAVGPRKICVHLLLRMLGAAVRT